MGPCEIASLLGASDFYARIPVSGQYCIFAFFFAHRGESQPFDEKIGWGKVTLNIQKRAGTPLNDFA